MTTAEAINHFKTTVALARALGVTPSAISQWGERPPLGRQYQIEVRTGGALRADRSKTNVSEDVAEAG